MTPRRLDDPARLAALRVTGLLDEDPGPAFERIARLARDLLGVPAAAVSVLDDRRERVIGQVGLEPPQGSLVEVPVADSHGAQVILEGRAVVVEDLREHPSLGALAGLAPSVAVALAAAPVASPGAHPLGVVCVIDRRPRAWSERDLARLGDLAELAATELELRAARRAARAEPAPAAMTDLHRLLSFEGRDIVLLVRAADGRVVGANQAAVDAYGYDRETLLGLTISDLRTPEAQRTMQDDLERAAEAGAGVLLESVHRRRDGTTFPVETSARGADAGGERLVLAIVRDVSERKAAEHERAELLVRAQLARAEAEQANRLKDEFLSTLSHELRTPLNAILGWTRMLQSGQLAEARRAHALATIERNAHVQARLVEDILDVSRIVSGKLPLEITALDPCAIVGAAVDSVRPAAEAKGLQLHVSCGRDLGTVFADPGRLQQVVWNLLSNAVKFTPRGGRVEVRLHRVDDQLAIEVSDTGQGIAPEFLPHVFERFRQADAGSARHHGGLGLGLAIVRHLVELHGGSVSVQSDGADRGATFIARLPLVAAEPEAPAPPVTGSPAVVPSHFAPIEREPSLEGVHVLVVDDELDARELLRSLLQSCGARVSIAASADEAALALREARPDLLVSDVGMPGEDGLGLISRVRASGPAAGGSIPAVALTAFARPEDRARALSAGFNAYLTKPVDLSLLLRTLARLLRRSLDP